LPNHKAQALNLYKTVTGDTFGVSINVSPDDDSSFEDIVPTIGPHTFANGTINLGPSNFDSSVDVILFMDETVVSPFTSEITISLFGQDAAGNLTNPVADGSLAENGAAFSTIWFDLGVFNGGTDVLTPTGPAGPGYTIDSAFVGFFNAAGELGGSFTPDFFSDSPVGISTSVGFGAGPDVATTDLNSLNAGIWATPGEFVGWQAEFTVTAVPEPTSASFLLFGVIGLVGIRRR